MQQFRFYSPQWLYSTCFGRQSHPSSGVHDTEKQYFDSLMLVMEKHKLVESKMFNVDGTKISTIQKSPNTLGSKGRKQGDAAI